MATQFRAHNVKMSRCRHCDHDLYVVGKDEHRGEIRCSNSACRFASKPYKMGKQVNQGKVAA